ncbi:unnamed protein product [Linum tenue]|uniref:Uncharacterized protein n=1 Tax=Linum tenue TaxID=586396 RepID=A0AAV0NMR6_9ROSI|nr:unnamed protein product [Linum tenue]
MVRLVVSFF